MIKGNSPRRAASGLINRSAGLQLLLKGLALELHEHVTSPGGVGEELLLALVEVSQVLNRSAGKIRVALVKSSNYTPPTHTQYSFRDASANSHCVPGTRTQGHII